MKNLIENQINILMKLLRNQGVATLYPSAVLQYHYSKVVLT